MSVELYCDYSPSLFLATALSLSLVADDFNILSNFLVLSNDVRQSCVIVDGVDDSIPEPTENVTLTLALLPPGSDNVIINTSTTLLISKQNANMHIDDLKGLLYHEVSCLYEVVVIVYTITCV